MSETDKVIRVGDPMPRLASVAHHNGYEIAASWLSGPREGKADIVDLAPIIMAHKVYRPLRDDPNLFKTVRLADDGAAIAWGEDDALDMAATTIERLAEETMTSSDFRAWLARRKFTYEAASAQLGISRRLVGYYADQRQVPRYIALACRYLDSRHEVPRDLTGLLGQPIPAPLIPNVRFGGPTSPMHYAMLALLIRRWAKRPADPAAEAFSREDILNAVFGGEIGSSEMEWIARMEAAFRDQEPQDAGTMLESLFGSSPR